MALKLPVETESSKLMRQLEQSQQLQDELIIHWLKRLATGAAKLHEIADGHGPNIRGRIFRMGRCCWPVADMKDQRPAVLWMYVRTGAGVITLLDPHKHREIVIALQRDIKHRPRAALRVIRTLQAAVAWCDARIVGHEKSRIHDTNQQIASKALDALRSEAVVAALAKE